MPWQDLTGDIEELFGDFRPDLQQSTAQEENRIHGHKQPEVRIRHKITTEEGWLEFRRKYDGNQKLRYKSDPRYRSQQLNRVRDRRAGLKVAGLTCRGTPRKIKNAKGAVQPKTEGTLPVPHVTGDREEGTGMCT